MTDTDFLVRFSDAIEARVRAASAGVATLALGGHRQISALAWRPGVLVTSEQSLPKAERYEAVLFGGQRLAATLAGRDPTTNVAVLRVEGGVAAPEAAVPACAGGVVIALGGDGAGGVTARTGTLEVCGPEWESRAGGRIDALLRIGARLPRAAEGGPVIDARGMLLGMSTFGPRRNVLVIPAATIARVLEPLLAHGRIARGWLGAGLHPVALPRELAERAGEKSGLMVVSLAEQGPARSVLLPGDILLAIGALPVSAPRAVAAALGPETIGTELALKILRGGVLATPSVTVAARPA